METNIAKIQKYKSWGMSLTPAIYKPDDKSKDKHPVCLKDEKGKFTWNVIAKKEWKDEDDIKTIVGCVLFIIGLSILFYYQDWFTFDHDGPIFDEIMIWKN